MLEKLLDDETLCNNSHTNKCNDYCMHEREEMQNMIMIPPIQGTVLPFMSENNGWKQGST
jgi:hypothetical protein